MKSTLKKILPKRVFEAIRWMRGVYVVDTTYYFHTYTTDDQRRTILPKKFNWFKPTELCHIMKGTGTDKALFQPPSMHNYTTFYYAAFKQFKDKAIRVFELGIGTTDPAITHNMGIDGKPGASLKGWKEFFQSASIYSADIDTRILFEEPRIKTFYVDQLNPEIIGKMWSENKELKEDFDIIIDDGLHTFESNTCFFENSILKLRKGGLYIIEDVRYNYLPKWKQIIREQYSKNYQDLRFTIIKIPNDYNKRDNNLVIIERLR